MDELLQALLARAMAKDSGWGADQGMQDKRDQLAVFDQLGPEGMRQQSNLGTLDERGRLAGDQQQAQMMALAQQLGQAQQMSQPVGKDYGSVAGNIAGGLGDVARQVGGGIRMHQLEGQQAEMLKQGGATQAGLLTQKDDGRLAGRTAQMNALRQALMSQPAPQAPMPAGGPPPMMGPVPGAPDQPGPMSGPVGWDENPWDAAMARRPSPRQRPQGNSLGLPPPSFFGL